jgi:rhodanese-related sulfurtransferase
MSRTIAALVTAFVFAVPSVVLACEAHKQHAAAKTNSVKNLTVTELAKLQQEGKPTILDANSKETRAKQGIIPGAKLLTSASRYDVGLELPSTKTAALVFYCANTRCTASHKAAERAISAGFTNVAVLPEGIDGWKTAGQKTAVPQS